MKFSNKLLIGEFQKRYKRFFADISFNGTTITAHVPNSGSMKGCQTAGVQCLFSQSDDPKRKLKYTLEAIRPEGNGSSTWIGVNTSWPNALVEEAFKTQLVDDWAAYKFSAREVKISDESRVDMVLWSTPLPNQEVRPTFQTILKSKTKFHFVEVKNVSLAEGNTALFPDSVTERGQKHIKELVKLIEVGHSAEIVFVIQRTDISHFSTADQIDPEYGKLLRQAVKKGLGVRPLVSEFNPSSLEILPKKITYKF